MKSKYKTSNEIIKSYTLEQVTNILKKFEDDFSKGKTTDISDWEYLELCKMTNHKADTTSDNNDNIKISYNGNIHILWKEKRMKLIPYFMLNNKEFSLKSFKYIKTNHIYDNSNVIIEDNIIKKISNTLSSSYLTTIRCPNCYGKTSEINDNLYCNNEYCISWWKYFYEKFVKIDKRLKQINYLDFKTLSLVLTKKVFDDYFSNSNNLKELYMVNLDVNTDSDSFKNSLDILRNSCDKQYIDLISKHLKSYLDNILKYD